MEIVHWDPKLEIGVQLIDDQHKELLKNINVFFVRESFNSKSLYVKDCIQFLEHYVLSHFQCEEAYQVDCQYPKYRSHQATHQRMASQLKIHAIMMGSAPTPEQIYEFKTILLEMFINHLLEDDFEFGIYYKENCVH